MPGPTLPQLPTGPAVSEILEELIPSSMNLDIYNTEYLQRGGTSPSVALATAKASQKLGAPEDEVSSTVFTLLNPDVDLSIEVGHDATPPEVYPKPASGFRRSPFLPENNKFSSSRRVSVTARFQVRAVNNIQTSVGARDIPQAGNWKLV